MVLYQHFLNMDTTLNIQYQAFKCIYEILMQGSVSQNVDLCHVRTTLVSLNKEKYDLSEYVYIIITSTIVMNMCALM